MRKSLLLGISLMAITLIISSCSGVKKITDVEKVEVLSLKDQVDLFMDSTVAMRNSLMGAIFYDSDEEKIIWEQNSDKYFTPASNTKILSLYASNIILGDSILAYKYDFEGDTLIVLANGDPSFLHHYTQRSQAAFEGLKNHDGPIKIYLGNFEDGPFGSGWAWDDYPYYYQPEKSPFPIYGNTIRFQKAIIDDSILVSPAVIKDKISYISDSISRTFQRDFGSNNWTLNKTKLKGRKLDYEIPFKYDEAIEMLLKDTLGGDLSIYDGLPDTPLNHIQYSVAKHEMLKWMMEESDNFYAEQLMLMSSNLLFDTMKVSMAIKYSVDSLFEELPDTIKWVDGSGLSRYNLFTPRSVLWILQKFDDENTDDDIQYYFPKITFIDDQEVYAKTGTLSNNRCLSGFLYTKTNKKILFSVMVNHHLEPTRLVNDEIGELIRLIGSFE